MLVVSFQWLIDWANLSNSPTDEKISNFVLLKRSRFIDNE